MYIRCHIGLTNKNKIYKEKKINQSIIKINEKKILNNKSSYFLKHSIYNTG